MLTSLVDLPARVARGPRRSARAASRVGFVGLAASKLPELFDAHAATSSSIGEPERAAMRLAAGEALSGRVQQPRRSRISTPSVSALGPRRRPRAAAVVASVRRPPGRRLFPLLASRGCPEFCTYCPHRILASYRDRAGRRTSSTNSSICAAQRASPYVVFRDPLFSEDRDRCLALCDEILSRGLEAAFECETRLDRLDPELLRHAARGRAWRRSASASRPRRPKR